MINNKKLYRKNTKKLTFEAIVNLIARKTNYQPRRSGENYILRCPSHEDTKASLSIKKGHDGRTLFKCFSSCALQEICSSIGLQVKDLFPNDTE